MFQFLVYSIFIILMVFVKKKNCLTFLNQQIKALLCKKNNFCYGKYHGKASIHSFFENSITTAINFDQTAYILYLILSKFYI